MSIRIFFFLISSFTLANVSFCVPGGCRSKKPPAIVSNAERILCGWFGFNSAWLGPNALEKKSFALARLYAFSSNSIFGFVCSLLLIWTNFFLSFSFSVFAVDEIDCVLIRLKKKIDIENYINVIYSVVSY